MKRRIALQNLATIVGGMVVMPAWADGWNKTSLQPVSSYLSAKQDALLAEIVDTFIPATDTPGAKDLQVHTFVQKMITDCYEPEVQQNMVKGLTVLEELSKKSFNQPFSICTSAQRMEVLSKMENAEESSTKSFYSLIKELTIQGYTTSEYVMVNHTNYQMVPGHYHGCVRVASK